MNLKAKHAQTLQVSMSGEVVGTLAQSERGQIWFEYDPTWIKSGFAVSPMASFELKSGAFKATNNNFDGLHGVFNDALPDGWGLLLMDRALKNKFGWDVHEITPLDRLAYIGNRAMGALEFKPTTETSAFASTPPIADLYEDALLVQEGRADEVMRALSILGGSPGGARPKITLALDSQGSDFVMSGFENIPANFDHWIVKFRSQNTDPICMGRIEMAYAEMAALAKVDIPPSRLICTKVRGIEESFFAIKRFDRNKNKKLHVVSLGGLLDASHREPSLDYTQLLKAVHFVTRDVREVERAFRLMVFNVLAHNKDDHVKNFAFIYDGLDWKFSPAFDLTFSGGMNNQHTTAVAGQGNPNLAAIEKVAKSAGIKNWKLIADEVFLAVSHWGQIAENHQVESQLANAYFSAIQTGPCYLELA